MNDFQQLWFKMIEYKLCFNKVFEFKNPFKDLSCYIEFIRYLNENIASFNNKEVNFLTNMQNSKYSVVIDYFVEKNPSSKNFYPKELSQLEEYYFGITEKFFSYQEVFWIEFISQHISLKNDFLQKIEEAISLERASTLDMLIYAA